MLLFSYRWYLEYQFSTPKIDNLLNQILTLVVDIIRTLWVQY